MKMRIHLLLLFLACARPLLADPAGTPAPSPRPLFLEVAGGVDLPVSGWQSAYSLAPQFNLGFGCVLDPHWALQLNLGTALFYGTNGSGPVSDQEILALPLARYQFGGETFRPYLLAGLGAEFELLSGSPTGTTVADLDAALGAGCETRVYEGFSLYLEGKYNLIFSSKVAGQDLPLVLGVHWDME